MEDTRRVLLAFLIIFVILFAWTMISGKQKPAPQPQPQPQAVAPPVQTAPVELKPALPVPIAATVSERLDTLENEQLRVVFSSQGGTIRSVRLRDYKVDLIPESTHSFGIGLLDGREYLDLSDQAMAVERRADTLRYTWCNTRDSAPALSVTRSYSLAPDYQVNIGISLVGANAGYLLMFRNGNALTEKNTHEEMVNTILMTQNRHVRRYGARNVKNGLQLSEPFRWVGSRSLYFLTALSARSGALDTVVAYELANHRIGWLAGVRGKRTDDRYQLYFGPLQYRTLRRAGVEGAFDFGRFLGISLRWLGLPILMLLQFLHGVLRNFGLAIIIFAIIMKGLFFPLSRAQNRQMRSMQMLQPKLEELKKRYKNNPEGLNRETMQLYRLYKVNPLSGCLPLLIQMPVFFALYQVLRISIDLRHAPFVFWITDLSYKDPYYVLPILMGVFSIIQSRLTSTGQQNKLLGYMMPIFITVIFLNFPSGLQLYWLMFNVLSIVESLIAQGGIKWQKKPHPAPTTMP